MPEVPTVKINYPANKRAGYAIINESDFDPKKHKLFDAPDEPTGGEGNGAGSSQGSGAGGAGSGSASDETPTLPKSATEILAMLEDKDVHFSTALAEAKKLLGEDKTPAKKLDLIDVLRAKVAETAAG